MGEVVPEDERPGDAVPGAPARRTSVPGGPVARRDVRVSDGERNAVVDELRIHYGTGRLDMDEFEDRTRAALAARVRGDLQPLLDDLPDLSPDVAPAASAPAPATAVRHVPPGGPPVRGGGPLDAPSFRLHLYLWLVLSAFLVVIWGATVLNGADAPFWPVFPIAGTGLTVAVHAAVRTAAAGPHER